MLLFKKKELQSFSGKIYSVSLVELYDSAKIGSGPRTYEALEILTDGFTIELSDGFEKKYWQEINKSENIGKKINVLYLPRLHQGDRILNPQELNVEDTRILTYENDKRVLKWSFFAIALFLLVLIIFLILLINTYKLVYLKLDREANSPFIWEFIKRAWD